MSAKNLKIDRLELDLLNPRIKKADDQHEAMQMIIDDQSAKLGNPAESIFATQPARLIFLPDTNVVSGLMRGDSRMTAWLASVREEDELVVCTIAPGEVLSGLGKWAFEVGLLQQLREGSGCGGFSPEYFGQELLVRVAPYRGGDSEAGGNGVVLVTSRSGWKP